MSWKNLIREINSSDGYILAVSGGVDSMCLLDFFNRTCNVSFKVAHFNHHIRDTFIDEDIVRNYCYDNGIELIVSNGINLKEKKNQENCAREQRWDFLEWCARINSYKNIVTAHHQNDAIENFILQIMRGNNIKSCTMKKNNVVNGINRFKPFLEFKKDDLIKSVKKFKVKWNEDETNSDENMLRNYVRHTIIPAMMLDRNVMKTIPKTIQSVLELK